MIKAKKVKCLCGCGKYVKPNYIRSRKPNDKIKVEGWDKAGEIIGVAGYGYLDNGVFNTLRCGFEWAIRRTKHFKID